MRIGGITYDRMGITVGLEDGDPQLPMHFIVRWPDGRTTLATLDGVKDIWDTYANYDDGDHGPSDVWVLTTAGPRKVGITSASDAGPNEFPRYVTVTMRWSMPGVKGKPSKYRKVTETFGYTVRES